MRFDDKMIGMLESPWLVPVPIPTSDLSWWGKLKALTAKRYFCLGKDWLYINSRGETCVIPGAFDSHGNIKQNYFVTDIKSYPRIVHPLLSPIGIGMTEGLVHDFCYCYQCQIKNDGTVIREKMDRKECDEEIRLIGIATNGMPNASKVTYWAVRAGGIFGWNKYRKQDGTKKTDVRELLKDYYPNRKITSKPELRPFEA